MVGQKLVREGNLDVKTPAQSTFAKGWRLPPWKNRHVQLVISDGGTPELLIQQKDTRELKDTFNLHNITDVTMVASKTHAHAFELKSGDRSVLILSGCTELDSREWIWTFRKLFWPQSLAQNGCNDRLHVQLISNADTARLGLPTGIYSLTISPIALKLLLVTRCEPGDRTSTPVEAFDAVAVRENFKIPITMIGHIGVENSENGPRLTIDTILESVHGLGTFVLERADESTDHSMLNVLEAIKGALFKATNNLHDCISSSHWTTDIEM